MGCARLLYDALLVYKATVLIVLMWGPYNHLLTRKFILARMKPNMNHLFCFVDLGKICNMNAIAIGTVELWAKFKTKWRRELYFRCLCMCIHMCACVCICVLVCVCTRVCLSVSLFVCTILQCDMCMKMSFTVLLLLSSGHRECW